MGFFFYFYLFAFCFFSVPNCFRFISAPFTQFVIVFKLLSFQRRAHPVVCACTFCVLMLCKLNGFFGGKKGTQWIQTNETKMSTILLIHNNVSEFVTNGILVVEFFPRSRLVKVFFSFVMIFGRNLTIMVHLWYWQYSSCHSVLVRERSFFYYILQVIFPQERPCHALPERIDKILPPKISNHCKTNMSASKYTWPNAVALIYLLGWAEDVCVCVCAPLSFSTPLRMCHIYHILYQWQ